MLTLFILQMTPYGRYGLTHSDVQYAADLSDLVEVLWISALVTNNNGNI